MKDSSSKTIGCLVGHSHVSTSYSLNRVPLNSVVGAFVYPIGWIPMIPIEEIVVAVP